MALHWLAVTLRVFEDRIIGMILARPGFHRAVRQIHRKVEDYQYGRDPAEPLRQGEATETQAPKNRGFLSYFAEELQNQARGTPTKPPPSPPQPPTTPR